MRSDRMRREISTSWDMEASFTGIASTASGIFKSNSSYSRWWRIEGIPPVDSTVSIIDIPGGNVVAGVHGEGLYLCAEDGFTAVPVTHDIPDPRISSCVVDGVDALVIGTDSGVYMFDHLERIILRVPQ